MTEDVAPQIGIDPELLECSAELIALELVITSMLKAAHQVLAQEKMSLVGARIPAKAEEALKKESRKRKARSKRSR
jgi:hypothetical protein